MQRAKRLPTANSGSIVQSSNEVKQTYNSERKSLLPVGTRTQSQLNSGTSVVTEIAQMLKTRSNPSISSVQVELCLKCYLGKFCS